MDLHTDVNYQYSAGGVCPKGCGLVLLQREASEGNHCCVSGLRAENWALLLRCARLEREALKQRVRWDAREHYLLAQVTSLHKEAMLSALTYQKKLQQYMLHISGITKALIGLYKDDHQQDPHGAGGVSMPHVSERGSEGQGEGLDAKGGILQTIKGAFHAVVWEGMTAAEVPVMSGIRMPLSGPRRAPPPGCDGDSGAQRSDDTSDPPMEATLHAANQVNGKDISKATHEEAVDVFRSAKDPIVVQVLRRNPVSRNHGNPQEARLVDVCTQTDITFEHIMALAKLRPTTPPVPDICPFLLSDSCHSLQTMDHEFYEGTDYLSPIPADIERTDEFEYEEVELCRLNSQEKLGLTLCYRTDDEEDVAIYVSKVGPNSIAARDGRIREGDRILQINGQDVQDREEAVTMLSSEVCGNVVLLVARPEIQLDEAWLDEEQNELLEELKMEMLEEQRKEEAQLVASKSEQPRRPEDDDITTDTATCSSNNQDKDSGVCRTDDSGRHDDTSEQEVLARVHRRLSQCLRERRGRGRGRGVGAGSPANSGGRSNRPPLKEEDEDEAEEEEREGGEGEEGRFRQLLELKCQIRNSGEYDLFYSRRSTIECSLAQQEEGVQEGVQRELRLLNEELRSIEQECQNIMQAHQLRLAQDQSPDRRAGSGKERRAPGPKLADITEHPERSDKDSSSAYNTAESSRSTPLAIERSPDHSLQRIVRITNQKNLRSSALAKAAGGPQDEREPAGSPPPPLSEEDHHHCAKLTPYPSPYHSSPYRPSIPAHARHYQSYMQLIEQSSAVEYGQSQLSLLSMCKDLQPHRPAEPKAEWKVKVRSDGTRYITKRPVRDRLLRERALKIREERSGGTTTDDDAASELKMGRYWSKEERKQHLLRAKEQRRRREFMMRSRLESLRESPQSGGEGSRKEVSILELSHRKMMKKRNRKILDNWMTIQELMTHGARAPEDPQVHNAFLSVTTV